MPTILQPTLAGLFAALILVLGIAPASSFATGLPTEQRESPDQPDSLDTAAVDSYVEDYLDQHGLAGAQVAVVKDGEVLHTGAYGQSRGHEITTTTPMATGSVGKHVTSFAMLQLVDDGEAALDDAVVEHLPEFELADDRYTDITIRQLLSHTSGMPSPIIVEPASNLREGVERLQDVDLQSEPGQQYAYSNMNYHIAARLIETVTEVPFATYLDENLFQPLGMDDTRSVNTTGADDPGLQAGHITAYGTTLPMREMDQLVAGAGGIVTTAQDQARWLSMLTNDGSTSDGEELLSPELLKEAQSSQPGTDGEGLGWHISGEGTDPPRVGHSGATSRYSAQLDIVPDSGYGVAVMLNSFTPAWEHNYSLSSGIIEVTEGRSPQPGTPVVTLIDAGLGALTLLVLLLTVIGLTRSGRWSARRAAWPAWLFGLRLLPQAIAPAVAVLTFLVIPSLKNNAATPIDVWAMWPAAMVLLLALAISGASLLTARLIRRTRRKEQR